MSKLQVNDIVNKDDDGAAGFSKGAVVTGVTTATSFNGTTVVASSSVSVGGTSVNTLIDGKTSPGKAIALSMVFG
tara:strand:+ start:3728 stop:3952 length:225 start_codon:yes stop_codon:yes gene_type:complete